MDMMTVQEATELVIALDDGEWEEAFDSLGLFNYLDTLQAIKNDMPIAGWKVHALLDYMIKASKQRDA